MVFIAALSAVKLLQGSVEARSVSVERKAAEKTMTYGSTAQTIRRAS
jgi:hypothetical protein